MSDLTGLIVGVLLLAGNAFFVGAEFALISARRTQIEPRAAAGSKTAAVTLLAMENVSLMMAGAQLGITICSLGLGAVGEPAVAHLIEGPFAALGMPEAFLHPTAFAIALSIVVLLHMVLGRSQEPGAGRTNPLRFNARAAHLRRRVCPKAADHGVERPFERNRPAVEDRAQGRSRLRVHP